MKDQAFREFMLERFRSGGFTTEDMLMTLLPLFRETLEAHNAQKVAPLQGLDHLHVVGGQAWFEESHRREISTNEKGLLRFIPNSRSAFDVIGETKLERDVSLGTAEAENLQIGEFDEEIKKAAYLPCYLSWEHEIENHDPLTDIFSLGMLMASLICGLDFDLEDDLKRFVENRANLFKIAPGLHPVVARVIVRTTERDRHRRARDLPAIIATLENYRDQETDLEFDLASIEGFEQKDYRTKQSAILSRLRDRLFDISKRNRLLNFRETMQSVNLTQASVPLSFDLESLRIEQLMTWNSSLHKQVCSGKDISLNKYLNLAEAIYVPGSLDRILAEARRDRAEFGMAQLRLAICFLSWANLKEKPIQQFESPLLLVPVKLKKKKGLSDKYSLEILETIAEVNPVVRHQFRQLYEIDLPESLDLEKTDVGQFYDYMASHIESNNAGVTLRKLEKPRVSLIHEKAKRRLDQYRRLARQSGRGMRSFKDLDYSYDPANFHPLGVKIFANFIQPTTFNLREIVSTNPQKKKSIANDETSEKDQEEKVVEVERRLVVMDGEEQNPYVWDFDLCNIQLANFKYRKMSLVRDYDALLGKQRENPAFDAVFSMTPRSVEDDQNRIPTTAIQERYDVVPCDPTQASSIAKARAGESYIIQGPPGTGKSQTIANLIADYVARGKRVLFVCEKRAAIDVVYSRLKQRGLGALCCLIHDSQTDKKGFVMDLKETYEQFLKPAKKATSRATALRKMQKSITALEQFHYAMNESTPEMGVTLRKLLSKCIETRDAVPELSAVEQEKLPSYGLWHDHQELLDELKQLVTEFQPDGVLSKHPLCCLSPKVADSDQPITLVSSVLESAGGLLGEAQDSIGKSKIPADQWERFGAAAELTALGNRLKPFSDANQLELLLPDSKPLKDFVAARKNLESAHKELVSKQEQTSGWREKIPARDLGTAIDQAKSFAGSFFAYFKPSWWRLRGVMNRSYDFASHSVKPDWSTVLNGLKEEYDSEDAHQKCLSSMASDFSLKGNPDEAIKEILVGQDFMSTQPDWLIRIFKSVMKSGQPKPVINQLADANETVSELYRQVDSVFDNPGEMTWEQLKSNLRSVQNSVEEIPDFLTCLTKLQGLPVEVRDSLRDFPFDFNQLENAIASSTYEGKLRENRILKRFDHTAYETEAKKLHSNYRDWLDGNAKEILTRQQTGFHENVDLCEKKASELTPEEKELKKHYKSGRRELEHEFGKTMRYKPIRDLMAGESGLVVNDLKPVWLMSPLSVSDTLPIGNSLVDVVIFDEASQVTLEEAIPTIFRSPQTIVVGDEMQLPPTNFFGSKKTEGDGLEFEDEGEIVHYDLNTNSLLSHSAKNLQSTLLGWHYRSRSESLISFSNRAFYNGRLLTVPEENLLPKGMERISSKSPESGCEVAKALDERPVSFHFMERGVYDNRRNREEAEYIAQMVKGLLEKNIELEAPNSIGIVAFSEAQQDEIEQALNRLAQAEPDFRARLDLELEREEDNQFVGLLVKNLENIQGDERDIIILSICYGTNTSGRMYMNFGPINKTGGEKRLNVAFSRAKKSMCIVSSITGAEITNDYNDGARCLKNYLSYAEAVSIGDHENMKAILQKLSRIEEVESEEGIQSPLANQIAAALESRGWIVDRAVGQSRFQCDLGVRKPEDQIYRLGIQIDGAEFYRLDDVLERDVMRPRLLEAFGWEIMTVLAKDWYENSNEVIGRISERLTGETSSG